VQKDSTDSPGPGKYDPSDSMRKSMPKFKMGTDPRHYDQKSKSGETPGPGSYLGQNDRVLKTKNGKFSTGLRDSAKPNNGPGPGSYRIPTKIVEAPRYLLPNMDETYSYV